MKKRLAIWCAVCVAVWAMCAAIPAYGDAQPVPLQRPVSVTLQYGVPDTEVAIYRVAEVYADGTYALTGAFRSYPVNIYGVTSQSRWTEIAETLEAYAVADGIAPTDACRTDDAGTVVFREMQPGMFLIRSVRVETPTDTRLYASFLLTVPAPGADGADAYDVTAIPKYEPEDRVPEMTAYKVVKRWADRGAAARPRTVEVDIFRDGVLRETQVLSPENHWTYSWTAPADGAQWQVVERKIPSGYTVTTTAKDHTFVITNTWASENPPNPPKTGESFSPEPYILAMGASGLVLLILAVRRMRVRT